MSMSDDQDQFISVRRGVLKRAAEAMANDAMANDPDEGAITDALEMLDALSAVGIRSAGHLLHDDLVKALEEVTW